MHVMVAEKFNTLRNPSNLGRHRLSGTLIPLALTRYY